MDEKVGRLSDGDPGLFDFTRRFRGAGPGKGSLSDLEAVRGSGLARQGFEKRSEAFTRS